MGEPVADVKKYAEMQRNFYNSEGLRDPENGVVGYYEYQERFPYETFLLYQQCDVRKPIFDDFSKCRALDVCCGEGRMARRLNKLFAKTDGVDISKVMIDLARERTPGNSEFWVTDGYSLGDAPSNAYEFVLSTIAMQHICVFETRDRIIKDICRVLRPDGKITLQYLYSSHYPMLPIKPIEGLKGDIAFQFFRHDHQHATWYENKTDATCTNSGCDVVIGPDEVPVVYDYFKKYFETVEFWYHDLCAPQNSVNMPNAARGELPNSQKISSYHGTHMLFVHCAGKKI